MSSEDDVRHHSARATKELDLGLVAQNSSAARSHLKLASMHMQKVRELASERHEPLLKM